MKSKKLWLLALTVTIATTIILLLKPIKKEQKTQLTTKEKPETATPSSLQPEHLSSTATAHQTKNINQALAELPSNNNMAITEQIDAINTLKGSQESIANEKLQQELAIKQALADTLLSMQQQSFAQQLNEVKHVLNQQSLTDNERYFYAKYYFKKALQQQTVIELPSDQEEYLAREFLSGELQQRTLASIRNRQSIIEQQQQYQQAYQALLKDLAAQRQNQFNDLTAEQWQQYSQQVITNFRRQYFQRSK